MAPAGARLICVSVERPARDTRYTRLIVPTCTGPYDARDVGRALGVRYVVQGDVRVVGAEISVHVVLADATTGRECWAEHLHRPMRDVLTIQEEIAELVVGSVESEIEHGERHRAAVVAPANLDAWSAYSRGCWHMYRFTAEDYELAEQLFRRSIELDPRSPCAYAGLSFIHWQRAFLELTPHRAGEERRALDFAQQALALDPRDPLGHWALGRAYLLSDDLDQAVDELETAVQLNPSSAGGQYALSYALMQTGDSARSNDVVARARRLSPYDVMTFAMYAVRAQNLAVLGQYAESAAFATRAARQPNAHYQVLATPRTATCWPGALRPPGCSTSGSAPFDRRTRARTSCARFAISHGTTRRWSSGRSGSSSRCGDEVGAPRRRDDLERAIGEP